MMPIFLVLDSSTSPRALSTDEKERPLHWNLHRQLLNLWGI
jgi:hypothetical protein